MDTGAIPKTVATATATGSNDTEGRSTLERFLTVPHSVPRFMGLEKGLPLGPPVLQFLTALETHFRNENITSDPLKISECKRFIHTDRGTAHAIINGEGLFENVTAGMISPDE